MIASSPLVKAHLRFEDLLQKITDPDLRDEITRLFAEIERLDTIPRAKRMELESIDDLVATIAGLPETTPVLYRVRGNDVDYLLVWIVLHDYFDKRGVPLVVFARAEPNESKYIHYDRATDEVKFANKRAESSRINSVRIIQIKEVPEFLNVG